MTIKVTKLSENCKQDNLIIRDKATVCRTLNRVRFALNQDVFLC